MSAILCGLCLWSFHSISIETWHTLWSDYIMKSTFILCEAAEDARCTSLRWSLPPQVINHNDSMKGDYAVEEVNCKCCWRCDTVPQTSVSATTSCSGKTVNAFTITSQFSMEISLVFIDEQWVVRMGAHCVYFIVHMFFQLQVRH